MYTFRLSIVKECRKADPKLSMHLLVCRETCGFYAKVSTRGYKTWEGLCLCSSPLLLFSLTIVYSLPLILLIP